MNLINNISKDKPIHSIIFISALFIFYFSNLENTLLFINDTARDSLKTLQIWNTKDLTLIGPPASVSLNNLHQVYFGSFTYYFALAGLIISKFNPIGASFHQGLLMILSVPLAFKLYNKWFNNQLSATFAILITYLSPLVVTHMRFYWNPNPLLALSFFFFFFLEKLPSIKNAIIVGFITGIMLNFHYISLLIIPIIFLSKSSSKRYLIICLVALFATLLPFIIFEIKNNFFLARTISTFLAQPHRSFSINPNKILDSFFQPYQSILAIRPAEIEFSKLIPIIPQILISTLLVINLITKILLNIKSLNKIFIYTFISTIILGLFTTNHIYHARYTFIFYPVIIYLIVWSIKQTPKPISHLFLTSLFILCLLTSIHIISNPIDEMKTTYPKIDTLELAAQAIINDQPTGKYNISESLHGDAQAIGLRYFLEFYKSPVANEKDYLNLDRIYILSTSLEQIKLDNRWEFTASSPWQVV